jgi:hypothetical protein
MVIFVPLSALSSRVLFRKTGVMFAEHLILHTYLLAQFTFVSAAIGAVILLFGPIHMAVLGALQALLLAYLAWASMQFFQVGRVTGLTKGLAVALLASGALAGTLFLLQHLLP